MIDLLRGMVADLRENAIVFLQNEYSDIFDSIFEYIEKDYEIVKVYAVGKIINDNLVEKYSICSMEAILEPLKFQRIFVFSDYKEKIIPIVSQVYKHVSFEHFYDVARISEMISGEAKLVLLREWIKKENASIDSRIIEVGDFTYYQSIDIKSQVYDGSVMCKMGKFCSIADKLTILLDAEHFSNWNTTYPFRNLMPALGKGRDDYTKGDVIIGNDVWIGYNVTILSGVTIGDGCVVGANSVVTKSIEPYSIVAGNPARVKKKRFSNEKIQRLLKIQWWNWPYDKIFLNLSKLQSEHIIEEI